MLYRWVEYDLADSSIKYAKVIFINIKIRSTFFNIANSILNHITSSWLLEGDYLVFIAAKNGSIQVNKCLSILSFNRGTEYIGKIDINFETT